MFLLLEFDDCHEYFSGFQWRLINERLKRALPINYKRPFRGDANKDENEVLCLKFSIFEKIHLMLYVKIKKAVNLSSDFKG